MVRVTYLEPRPGGADLARDIRTSDLLAFSFFVLLAKWSRAAEINVRMISDTIAEDATWYFLVIFTSHVVLVLTLNFARVSAINPLFVAAGDR